MNVSVWVECQNGIETEVGQSCCSLMIEMQSSVFFYTRWNVEKPKPRIQKYFSQNLACDENGVVEWIVWRIMINMRIGDTGNWQFQEHWQEAVNEQTRNQRIWWDDLIESPNPTNLKWFLALSLWPEQELGKILKRLGNWFLVLQLLVLGQSGGNGQSATHLRPIAWSSGFATAPMPPRPMPAMETQLRQLPAHRSPPLNHSARIPPVQVSFWKSNEMLFGKLLRSNSPN